MDREVTFREDGDTQVIRWSGTGREHSVRPGDDDALMKAWKAAVAEGLAGGETPLGEVDRGIARELQGRVGVRKDASGGLIVAYWPDPETAATLAAIDGCTVAEEDLHLTLLYLDDGEGMQGHEWDIQLVAAVLKIWSTKYWDPLDCIVTGLARFVGAGDEDVVVALVDCQYLAEFRRALRDELEYHAALPGDCALYSENAHGFLPHITIAYVPKSDPSPSPLPEVIPFGIDNVTLASGDNRAMFPFRQYDAPSEGSFVPEAELAYKARHEIEKVGRTLSGANLAQAEVALEALTALVESERGRVPAEEPDEAELEKRRAILAAHGVEGEADIEYIVTKATKAKRFTLGPLYAPNRKDAHGEFVDPDVLQEAVWEYARKAREEGGRLRLQHNDLGDITVAEMVELVTWPYDHEITVKTVGGEERKLEMPAGTVYLGAIWDEDSWPLVEKGMLNGWSLGGRAVKVASGRSLSDLESMGDASSGA